MSQRRNEFERTRSDAKCAPTKEEPVGKSVEQLVNQEVLRWLNAQAQEDTIPDSRVREMQRPVITISREYGAGGGELGRALAKDLDIDFFAQELVHEVAKRTEVRKQVVEALDERTRTRVQLWVDQLLQLRTFAADDYIQGVSETVVAIARHSRGVIVGRGAHLLLDKSRTLRVRCVAPLEERIEYVVVRERMSPEEARAKVARVDREREDFFRNYFNTDIASPLSFDIVINTGAIRREEARCVISELYRKRFGN